MGRSHVDFRRKRHSGQLHGEFVAGLQFAFLLLRGDLDGFDVRARPVGVGGEVEELLTACQTQAMAVIVEERELRTTSLTFAGGAAISIWLDTLTIVDDALYMNGRGSGSDSRYRCSARKMLLYR